MSDNNTNTNVNSTSTSGAPNGMQTSMCVLDSLIAINLAISLWSARKKMQAEDFGGAELPPDDIASLGSKKIADPERLRIFSTLKSRAFSFLDRHGVRFMSGWAIPETKVSMIVAELIDIRDAFMQAKEDFLADYDEGIQEWVGRHKQWGDIIRNSTVSSDYVRSRIGFTWNLFKVEPVPAHVSDLQDEVANLGGTLFQEIAKSADDIWKRVYEGKAEVTHKALSPLKTLHSKLHGLALIDPHVRPAADLIQTALDMTPTRKGNITGTDLLMLQGVVSMLRNPKLLYDNSQKILDGSEPWSVIDSISMAVTASANAPASAASQSECEQQSGQIGQVASSNEPSEAQSSPAPFVLPSLGLW